MFTIREWRRIRDITQERMAEMLGISPATYISWEKEPSKISIANCYKIADLLGVKFSDVIFMESN